MSNHYPLLIALIGATLLWGGIREYASGNTRDSGLMLGLAACMFLAGAGMFFAASS